MPEQVLVLAGGSNLVISDTVTELTVVRLASDGLTIDGDILRVEAGAVWDDVVAAAIEHGLGGLECLSGIPGSAGATPVQNVGAYGAEVSDTITRVRLLDRRSGAVGWVPAAELRFGYRTSALKGADARPAVVLEVEFALDALGPQRSAALWRADHRARCGQRRTRRPGRRSGGRTEVAQTQGHGARRRRPRHLERRLVLHQSGGDRRDVPAAGRPGRRAGAALLRRPKGSSWPLPGWWNAPVSAKAIPAPTPPPAGCPPSMRLL